MAFLKHVSELLEENGEYVDAQALTPARTWVRYGGPAAVPVTTDGPLPETSDLVAGWYMIDVESHERAVELAAYVSSGPGPGGEPLYEWIDVREVMSDALGRLTRRDRLAGRQLDEGALRALRPAGARGPGPAGRGLRRRRGRTAGGAAGGAAGVARAPAARPARVAGDGRDPAARSSTPAAARPPVSAVRRPRYGGPGPAATEEGRMRPSSCSSAAATPSSRPPPRCR